MTDDSTPVNIPQLAERLDQQIDNLKESVEARFVQHEQHEGSQALALAAGAVARDAALHLLLQEWRTADKLLLSEWRVADKRLLDERFDTQTTSLQTALTAQQTALGTALQKADETERRTGAAIKAIDDRQREGGGRSLGRSDVIGWVVAGAAVVFALIQAVR